jgi:hypothetical protein
MHPETDEAAIQADAYIDALLYGHGRMPIAVGPESDVGDAIRLLERGLPRFHPSFVFEQWLSGQLQRAASIDSPAASHAGTRAQIAQIVIRADDAGVRGVGQDRRLWVGGAIASGVSIAGAAVLAWRRTRHVAGSAD